MKSGFIYAADLWCEDCGLSICKRLLTEGNGPQTECGCGWKGKPTVLVEEESTLVVIAVDCPECHNTIELHPSDYDSDDFPKGEIVDGEADSPQHCGAGADCINAEVVGTLPDGSPWKIGEWLENDLTSDGIKYLRESIMEEAGSEEPNPVTKLWAEWYYVTWPSSEPNVCQNEDCRDSSESMDYSFDDKVWICTVCGTAQERE